MLSIPRRLHFLELPDPVKTTGRCTGPHYQAISFHKILISSACREIALSSEHTADQRGPSRPASRLRLTCRMNQPVLCLMYDDGHQLCYFGDESSHAQCGCDRRGNRTCEVDPYLVLYTANLFCLRALPRFDSE